MRRVLEVGAGNGAMRQVLCDGLHPELVVSTDIDAGECADILCDGQRLPFKEGSFDAVAAFEVLEHVPAPDRLIAEASRVLSPTGYLILSVPFVFGRHDVVDYHRFTAQALQDLLERHSLHLIALRRRGGTFLAINGLILEYLRQLFVPRANTWRVRSRRRRVGFAVAALVLLPVTTASWLAYALDGLLDPNSDNASGFVVLASRVPTIAATAAQPQPSSRVGE